MMEEIAQCAVTPELYMTLTSIIFNTSRSMIKLFKVQTQVVSRRERTKIVEFQPKEDLH